jgi:aspartyl-tRNA(Asn)/glutamyl-tRNA(Gln) amidotransferase subunit A
MAFGIAWTRAYARIPEVFDRPLWQLSARELAVLLRRRQVSTVEVADAVLARIGSLNGLLRAYIAVDVELTLRQARDAQARRDRGEDSPLLGIPVSLKDAFDTSSLPTTYGAAVYAGRRPDSDSTVARRLHEGGAVLLGKTNLLEFCWGPTEAYPFGQTVNPWNPDYSPGGSSSGAGAAVAAGLGPVAIGTDTGGSVRNPASFCGVVGLKPTFGLIGRGGMFPLSFTLDHVGVLARRVADVALVAPILAGRDPQDPGTWHQLYPTIRPFSGALLVPRRHFWEHLEADVDERCSEALSVLAALGFTLREVELRFAEEARSAIEPIILAESAKAHGATLGGGRDGVSDAFRGRMERGAALPAGAYAIAMQTRQRFTAALADVLQDGVIVVPTSPYAPYALTDPMATGRGEVTRVIGQCTGPFNLAGTPALTVPCGFTPSGLPVGLQLIGRWGEEPELFRIAQAYEEVTRWWEAWPPM